MEVGMDVWRRLECAGRWRRGGGNGRGLKA